MSQFRKEDLWKKTMSCDKMGKNFSIQKKTKEENQGLRSGDSEKKLFNLD